MQTLENLPEVPMLVSAGPVARKQNFLILSKCFSHSASGSPPISAKRLDLYIYYIFFFSLPENLLILFITPLHFDISFVVFIFKHFL